ncbi:hypothetical protein [Bacillus sp. FJAT-45037]|nr:hypothetical protein [Bacillus sp. FJAT-45037]
MNQGTVLVRGFRESYYDTALHVIMSPSPSIFSRMTLSLLMEKAQCG